MTEKDLKKLNRYQLLELLIVQTERANELQARLDEAEKKLTEHELKVSSLGSIAEESLYISEVFKSAQKAADMYVEAAKKHAKDIEKASHKKAMKILMDAKEQARRTKGE